MRAPSGQRTDFSLRICAAEGCSNLGRPGKASYRYPYCHGCDPSRSGREYTFNLKKWQLRNCHNLGIEAFEHLLYGEQGGRCAICFTDAPSLIEMLGRSERFWHVDHDHRCCDNGFRSCGECVRGILCPTCSVSITKRWEDMEWAERALAYVHKERNWSSAKDLEDQP